MAKIPLTFDYSEDKYPGIEYKFLESQNHWEICFSALNLSFLYDKEPFSEECYYLDIEEIEKLNPSFKAHGRFGYSSGSFHELFLHLEDLIYVSFRIENAEISLGDATPLSRLIFNHEHRNKYHGEWEYIQTIKLLNVEQADLEVYLLNALNRIQVSTRFRADLQSICGKDYAFWLEQQELAPSNESEPGNELTISNQLEVYKDLEAVSLYRYALTTRDNISACIYYYRVIEFYAFLRKHDEIEKIRQDESIDSKDFSKKIHELVKANELKNVCGLIEETVSSTTIDFALRNQLIHTSSKQRFAEALYKFRNGIVHAKYEHTNSLIVDSILNASPQVTLWREVMSRFIPEILDRFGI
jgi:hypothetical protein